MLALILNNKIKTVFYTLLALIAFAANSVLCRMALGQNLIDASSFTVIRLLSGAVILVLILQFKKQQHVSAAKGSWLSSLVLFLYAITFSYAYVSLDTATGALILFGAVQITMILASYFSGNRLDRSEWVGLIIACMGFVYLFLPSISTPSIVGATLMFIAGIAWGIYSIRGRGSLNPLYDTAYNFSRTIPFIIILAIVTFNNTHASNEGIILAIISGGVASGLGYTIWYRALGGLSRVQAAVVQLLVPVIATFGGVIFISEMVTVRLSLAATMILGGILIVVLGKYYVEKLQMSDKRL